MRPSWNGIPDSCAKPIAAGTPESGPRSATQPATPSPGANEIARSVCFRPRHDAEVVEHGGPKVERELPHALQELVDELARLDEIRLLIVPTRRVERELDAGEHLPDLVVELTGDAPSLPLLRAEA